jgi:hypothetical protein
LPKKKEHIKKKKKTKHTTITSYILNFIQHYFVEVNSSVDELLEVINVDFDGMAQLLVIYSAVIKKNGIQRRSSSTIYRYK